MIKKTIFALVLFLLANTVNASVLIEWGPNPTTEQIFQYTLYWQKDGAIYPISQAVDPLSKKRPGFLLFLLTYQLDKDTLHKNSRIPKK